ncbi:MAG TPA: TetR/AcrR family transcriptional regulator [Acidimicrobiales bacterium]|nr:TetR/AcrR family transcriptional regulator [Acidimicrobiales bacterium]
MNALTEETSGLLVRLREVPAPKPVITRQREKELTKRQREVLDQLSNLFDSGFAEITMSEIASRVNCSLRTLYEIANSKDELVLIVIDRNLRKVGRTAIEIIDPWMTPLEAIRLYLETATVAVESTTEEFARDLEIVPSAQKLSKDHSDYLVAITRSLLDLAVEREDIANVDTAAVARVVAGLGRDFAHVDVMKDLRSSPKVAADDMLEIIMKGLVLTDRKETSWI